MTQVKLKMSEFKWGKGHSARIFFSFISLCRMLERKLDSYFNEIIFVTLRNYFCHYVYCRKNIFCCVYKMKRKKRIFL